MKISVVMHTCRKDHPKLPAPVLRMMCDSMLAQDYDGDVELIIVDLAWKYRHDEFMKMLGEIELPEHRKDKPMIEVLHVPDRPTPFRERKLLRIAAPKNTGAMLARGDWVIFTDDCQVLPPNALSLLAEWAKQGVGATMSYEKRIWNPDGEDTVTGRDARGVSLNVPEGSAKRVPPRQIGFLGGTMSMLPMEALLELNGFDEMFDGSRQLEDADMCLRLAALGQNMAYEQRARVIEYEVGAYDERVVSTEAIKCNGAYADWIWKKGGRVGANTGHQALEAVKAIQWQGCARLEQPDVCTPHRSPCTKMGDPKLLEAVYLDPRLAFSLRKLREVINWGNAEGVLAP
jgi:cellulose synthase/poly-beta-1,6-N-acetylglucosamine synthase-like glycosyltransferase